MRIRKTRAAKTVNLHDIAPRVLAPKTDYPATFRAARFERRKGPFCCVC